MGDRSGEIHVFKLNEDSLKPVTTLKGHSGIFFISDIYLIKTKSSDQTEMINIGNVNKLNCFD